LPGVGVGDIVLFPTAVANGKAVARRSAATEARAAMTDIEHLSSKRRDSMEPTRGMHVSLVHPSSGVGS
jgi:hypothetical protein